MQGPKFKGSTPGGSTLPCESITLTKDFQWNQYHRRGKNTQGSPTVSPEMSTNSEGEESKKWGNSVFPHNVLVKMLTLHNFLGSRYQMTYTILENKTIPGWSTNDRSFIFFAASLQRAYPAVLSQQEGHCCSGQNSATSRFWNLMTPEQCDIVTRASYELSLKNDPYIWASRNYSEDNSSTFTNCYSSERKSWLG